MKRRVSLTRLARTDLKHIGRYIATESGSVEVATKFLRRINERCEQYARQPEMGSAEFDLGEDVRCFTVASYVVIYRIIKNGIRVLTVVHAARDFPTVFRDDRD